MSHTDTATASAVDEQISPEEQAERMRRAKRAGLSAFLGGALEYYDFFLYATAASLVFPVLFFPADSDPAVAAVQSFATLGVAYVARPFGAVFFGHLGDRIGRKNVLLATLMLMGIATFLIGVLPTYEQVGLLAPILLVVLRLAQGLSAGAEIAGASALSTEEAPVGLRGFFPSFSLSGIAAGIVLASLAFLPVAAMDEVARHTWGWRIPFLLSLVVLAVAYFVRRSLAEPEAFEEAIENADLEHEKGRAPFMLMITTHPVQFIQIALMSLQTVTNTLMQAFGLAYAKSVGIDPAVMLWITITANTVAILTTPLFGWISDKIGRKPTFIAGITGSAVLIWPYFGAISQENVALVFVFTMAILCLTYAMSNSVYPSWFSELFNVRVRYSGMAVGLQLGILIAGFTPMMATAMVGTDYHNYGPAAWLVAGSSILAFIGAVFARETYRTPLRRLGNPVNEAERQAGHHHGH
jgi:MFS family permease